MAQDAPQAVTGAAADAPLAASGKVCAKSYGSVEGHVRVGIPAVCWCILVVELCERLAFYTIAGSQAFFLEHIGFSLSNAGSLNATMWTLCTVLAVFASWTADVGLGRYWTIFVSGIIYVLGTLVASIAALPGRENSTWYFIGVMGLLPIATAGIKANISNFGADQYDSNDPAQRAAQESFFSIFYCSINVGAVVAYGFFTTFASSGGLGVPKPWGYAVAYSVMSGCMLVAVGVFSSGRARYSVQPLQRRSALASLFGCLRNAWAEGGSHRAGVVFLGILLLCVSIVLSAVKTLMSGSGDTVMILAFACAALGTAAVVVPCLDPRWLSSTCGQPTAEEREVQQFLALMPPLFTGSLAFNALYNCMQFWYQQQACQMDVRMPFGTSGFQLSGSFFNVADCLAIIIGTPLVVSVANPYLDKFFGRHFGHGQKFATGMSLAVASVLVAARLEVARRAAPVLATTSNCAPPGIGMSDMHGAWMMLPFFLMGFAEIYTQPTLLHLAYSKSPPSMRTLALASSFFIAAVSSALFALLVTFLSPYMPNDLNKGHLEYGYFISVAVGLVFLALFRAVLKE